MSKRLTIIASLAILVVLVGLAFSTEANPFNFESFPHAKLVEIKLREVTPEKVTFTWFGLTFYVEGEAETAGEIGSEKAYIFQDQNGTYCVEALDPAGSMGGSMSEEGIDCLYSGRDLDRVHYLTRKWLRQSEKGITTRDPIWASR